MNTLTLPTLDPRATTETLASYGYRIVMFLIACEVTATLSTEDLQLAQHTMITIYHGKPSDKLVTRLRAMERILSAVLAYRAQCDADGNLQDTPASRAITPATPPTIGPMAKDRLQPIVPKPSTPARVDFAF